MEQNNLPTLVFTADEVKQIERDYARVHNGHCFDLMQKAGAAVFETILKECNPLREVWIFCGKGNNGGDGYLGMIGEEGVEYKSEYCAFSPNNDWMRDDVSVAVSLLLKKGTSAPYTCAISA